LNKLVLQAGDIEVVASSKLIGIERSTLSLQLGQLLGNLLPNSEQINDAHQKHDGHNKKSICLEILSCPLSRLSFLGIGVIKHPSPFQ
jgi:hypothetical protein